MEIFVQAIRKFVSRSYVTKKNGKYEKEPFIIYDNEFIWIQPKKFDWALHYGGLYSKKSLILTKLRENGSLLTDSRGFKHRLMVDRERLPFYHFRCDKLHTDKRVRDRAAKGQ